MKVLIGYSKNFSNKNLFEKKINRIMGSLESYQVIALGDENQLIADMFSERVIDIIPYRTPKTSVKKYLDSCSHVILFWDGDDINEFIYKALLLKKNCRIITVETTKVVNKDKGEPFDVYIGRGTPWGNPFAIGDGGMDRTDVVKKYEEYFNEIILKDENKRREILGLKGKILGCHCKPQACHGDVIANFLNSEE